MTIAARQRRQTPRPSHLPASPRQRANSVRALRRTLGVTRAQFARLTGRTERAINDWEADKARPQGLSLQRVHELERLTAELGQLVDAASIGKWFDSPNPVFGGLKPVEVIERGEIDRLWRMIFELRAGTHT